MANYNADLTAERLRDLYDYDPLSGVFIRRLTRGGYKAGTIAGCANAYGYLVIRIDDVLYQCSRLAWLHMHGRWPADEIDHINRDQADNRLANLRETNRQLNNANTRVQKNSKTGVKGVIKTPNGKRWLARIMVNRKSKHLGVYDTSAEASRAYMAAAEKHFGQFASLGE